MTRIFFLIAAAAVGWSGCGVVGSPVAPEDVGVTPIIERQKKREAAAAGRSSREPGPATAAPATAGEATVTEPPEDLPVPPVQSVGTGVGTTGPSTR